MTEDEAKTKWCPQTRWAAAGEDWDTNRSSFKKVSEDGAEQCLGSACMAWRWLPDASIGEAINGKRKGYCGLVGSPNA